MLGAFLLVVLAAAVVVGAVLLFRAAYAADRQRLRVIEERWRAEQRLQALTRSALAEMRAEVRRFQRGRR